ncbi:TIGR02281 family clan AA aspartic protease [Mesorhizobium sp. LHD-90]|uniref:TIGR02281 family clan AA aspartic protease n=1 Tax=Mesorhizobium sp. LHD-90 TaxID=3071414 RepID=UPI0027E01BBE|nr:TIGR02281 family clan AA aspartic protease [Mesorhizobium sp. LHD-90]MDQ6437860.1 TIGR02281 family clan AA aspartic protease [Mesorhizobium sp. LHD-90]
MNRLTIGLGILGVGLVVLLVTDSSGSVLGLDNDRFARLVYLGAIVAVISAGLVSSRRQLSGGLRAAALWLAMLLALVAGYQYRYELQDVLSRVTAGLVPGSPLSVTDADGRATVMMEKRPNGHFEVRGTVEGADVEFLIDTGATSTVLTTEDARRAGIDIGALSYSIPIATANGTTHAASARAREITVGAIIRRNQPILVAAEGTLGQSLLGMNFISTLSGFDMRGDRLILRD